MSVTENLADYWKLNFSTGSFHYFSFSNSSRISNSNTNSSILDSQTNTVDQSNFWMLVAVTQRHKNTDWCSNLNTGKTFIAQISANRWYLVKGLSRNYNFKTHLSVTLVTTAHDGIYDFKG